MSRREEGEGEGQGGGGRGRGEEGGRERRKGLWGWRGELQRLGDSGQGHSAVGTEVESRTLGGGIFGFMVTSS